ncbi:hypothetical protein TH25_04325 [Thalassospira profundimaris]|uniref:Phasin domain-containing protein n=1 Tax=Thalassospira profundimaris TaxID=502049 RepID=A0A367XJX8_9PROT|nr:phasin family protein [Thalassospira profundimaris]RCK53739.1 hypothetical protein TH25_04325 [Thalassospira profundimaris]
MREESQKAAAAVSKTAEVVKGATEKQVEAAAETARKVAGAASDAVVSAAEKAPKAPKIEVPVAAEVTTPVGSATVSVDEGAKPKGVAVSQKIEADLPMPTMPVSQMFEFWNSGEMVDMVSSARDAANEALSGLLEAVSGHSDMISDAGAHFASQYEDLLQSHLSNWDGMMQASSKMADQSGRFGKEWMTWMQREIDALQGDIEALSKVESLGDIQEINARMVKRFVDDGMAEHSRFQEIWFGMWNDSVALMEKSWSAKAGQ